MRFMIFSSAWDQRQRPPIRDIQITLGAGTHRGLNKTSSIPLESRPVRITARRAHTLEWLAGGADCCYFKIAQTVLPPSTGSQSNAAAKHGQLRGAVLDL
jgi:hypothetical protein